MTRRTSKKASSTRGVDAGLTPAQKRERAKAARRAFTDDCSTFVEQCIMPKVNELAETHGRSVAEVRAMLTLGVAEAVKKRHTRLWDAVVQSALHEEPDDFKGALTRAQEINEELKDAIANERFDDPLLIEYQTKADEMEAQRARAALPTTEGKTERAVLLLVARYAEEIRVLLRNLHFATDAEYLLVVCKGNADFEFTPFVESSSRADGFLEYRMKLDARKFAIAMEGHVLWGADALQNARTKDIPHKSLLAGILGTQLQELTHTGGKMQWAKWDAIADQYGLEMVGWPKDIKFKPLHLLAVSQAKRLHKLALDGRLRIAKRASDDANGATNGATPVAPSGSIVTAAPPAAHPVSRPAPSSPPPSQLIASLSETAQSASSPESRPFGNAMSSLVSSPTRFPLQPPMSSPIPSFALPGPSQLLAGARGFGDRLLTVPMHPSVQTSPFTLMQADASQFNPPASFPSIAPSLASQSQSAMYDWEASFSQASM